MLGKKRSKSVATMLPTRDFLSISLLLSLQLLLCFGLSHDLYELVHRDVRWECTTNTECTALNSSCENGQCQCPAGFMYNVDMTSCLRVATAYGDECTETIQCSAYLFSGAECIDGACACGIGYYYLHGRCYPTVGLHEACRIDEQCFVHAEFGAASCINGFCKCSPGFYQREHRTCRRAAEKVGDKCFVDHDCIFDTKAVCNSKFMCELPASEKTQYHVIAYEENIGYEISDILRSTNLTKNEEQERMIFHSECKEDSDCASLGNALCHSTGNCICARAHFPSADKSLCIPELGEPCGDKDKTLIKYAVCRDGVWSCKDRMVALKNNRQCKKANRKYNFTCTEDEQCNVFGPDSECRKTCICNEHSHFVEDELFCWMNKGPEESCKHENDCYMDGFSGKLTCSAGICSCPKGTHLNFNKTTCINAQAEIGMSCEVNEDCITKNSQCLNEKCTCQDYYYEENGACILGLNGTCTTNTDCGPDKSICNGTCSCEDGFVEVSEKSCMSIALIDEPCENDIQCSTQTSNAVCAALENTGNGSEEFNTTEPLKKVCKCADGYYLRFDRCYRKKVLGEKCTMLAECYLDTQIVLAVCRNEVCSCTWGYKASSPTRCIRDGKTVEAFSINGSGINTPRITGLAMVLLVLQISRTL